MVRVSWVRLGFVRLGFAASPLGLTGLGLGLSTAAGRQGVTADSPEVS